jgi:hypothetical protein
VGDDHIVYALSYQHSLSNCVSEEFSSDPMSWHEVVGCDVMCDGLGRRNTSVLFRRGGW